VLASAPAGGAGGAEADGSILLPRLAPLGARWRLPRVGQIALGPVAGRIALGSLMFGAFAVVAFATAQHSPLVPRSALSFPHWESGPLHGLFGHLTNDWNGLSYGLSVVLVLMLFAYVAALMAVRTFSMKAIAIWIVAMHVILLMSPPLQLTDLFNYLGYARLGAVHHLNPYTHGISWEIHDPVFRFTTWHHLHSPYGYLFTAITYPIALLPIPVAYWVLKLLAVGLSLTFIWLVWKCARLLGRDPRFAVLFVAANPIYLMYAVGGFHNDFFMLVPSTAAIAFLLARKDRSAGAAVMVAVAVKFTAVLLLPFLLIAARPPQRRLHVIAGAVLATIPLAALSIGLFGFTVPNLQDQSTLLTDFSVPNIFGDLFGLGGGTPTLLRLANVALVVTVLLFLRRRRDWLSGAGWSTLALVASLAWLVPWYVIWVLPLAALSTSVRLRRAAVVFTVYLVLAFIPATAMFLARHGINPLGSSAGQASKALQKKLAE
jgi:alpha-1,6-mannosyltransferase